MQNKLQNTLNSLRRKLEPEEMLNFYPLMHAPIATTQNIEITGTFSTNDTSELGQLSYVTVGRDIVEDEYFDPASGLGFAWKKSVPPEGSPHDSDYNVYLVDNNPLTKDFFINPYMIVQDTGENSFLAASREFPIQLDTDYSFRFTIDHHPSEANEHRVSLKLELWEGTSETPPTDHEEYLIMEKGPYVPRARGPYFGISVLGTKGSEWFYNNIRIRALSGTYAIAMFRFKPDSAVFAPGANISFKYFGFGKDGDNFGLVSYIYNPNTSEWDFIGDTDALPGQRFLDQPDILFQDSDLIGNYLDASGHINIMVMNETSESISDARVATYYTSLEKDAPFGVHAGGKADIYVNDPTKIVIATTSEITIPPSLQVDLAAEGVNLPLHTILQVELSGGGTLIAGEDWWLTSPDQGSLAFSTQESPVLHFVPESQEDQIPLEGAQVVVTYRYYLDGQDIQTFIESPEYRLVGVDNLAKIYPPIIVTINNLEFVGNVSINEVRTTVKNFVNNLQDNISVSNLISALRDIGVTHVDLVSLDILLTEYNEKRQVVSEQQLTNIHERPDFRVYFTDNWELTGVTRQ